MSLYLYTACGGKADALADWLEELAGQIRARQTRVVPDRMLVAFMEGNARDGSGDLEVLHRGLTLTMADRVIGDLRAKTRKAMLGAYEPGAYEPRDTGVSA